MAEDVGFGRLPRGASFLWERVASSRTFSLGFFYGTGSRCDPAGRAGTAHLAEHLVFKGTLSHSASSLARLVDRVGGDLNAWTDREEMAFTCTVPAEHWAVAVEALAELCLFPTFPDIEFEREKDVIRNEVVASLEDPEDLSFDQFLRLLSPGPWSRPVAGTLRSLAAISLDDVKAWWRSHGGPSRLTAAFSGDADPEAVGRQLAVYLERLGPEASGQAPAGPSRRYSPGLLVAQVRRRFQMVQVLASFTLPPPADFRTAGLWQAFSMLWGETMSSRLFQALREDRGLCYSVTTQVFEAEGAWSLQVFSTCVPEKTAALVAALAHEVSRLSSDPPSAAEWDDARLALRGGLVLASERTEGRVGRLWHFYSGFGVVRAAEDTEAQVGSAASPREQAELLGILTSQRPSLLLWGPVPRGLDLSPWPV